ncbi:MAG TPA: xanthine dehydrogenase family protein subunit M [Chloroflexota bacterium]
MKSFSYHAPRTLADVFEVVDAYGEDAHLIAGGTALVLLMKQGLVQPAHVVSLRDVDGLGAIHASPGLTLGALATHRQLEVSPAVRAYDASLARAFAEVATIRIRSMATLGGNLVHADPAQDPPPMLIALRAEVVLLARDGERRVPLDEFFVDYFETAIRHGEVLTRVELPPKPAARRTHYVKFLPRTADDYATVAVATAIDFDADGMVEDARIVLGAAAPTVLRARAAEDVLRGQKLTPELMREAGALARTAADPLDDSRGSAAYKKEMVAVWVRRSLEHLLTL